jgi:hypothetical protein
VSLPTPSLPSSAGAYTLTAGGFTINLPNSVSSGDEAIDFESYTKNIEGRDGLFQIREPSFRGRNIELSGYIFDSDTIDTLKRVLSRKRVTITRDERDLVADLEGVSITEVQYGSLWRIALSFKSFNYYWDAKFPITTGSSPLTITNNGDLTIFPSFDFTVGAGGATVITIELAGRTFTWDATASSGQILGVNFDTLEVELDGVGQLDYVNDAFFTQPIRFEPGDNTFTVSVTGTATWAVTYRERYL